MDSDYIRIMTESLEKKKDVLLQIIEENKKQETMLHDPNLSPEEFEKNLEDKAALVEQLGALDEGFENLFERVRETLDTHREEYVQEIGEMQDLIREITAYTNTIQTQEVRSKEQVAQKFSKVREQVKGVRNSQKVVKQYYQNMMRDAGDPNFIDNKK